MDIFSQLTSLVRAKANDLLRPRTPVAPASPPADQRAESTRLLNAAQERAVKVNQLLVLAEAREKNAELAWHDAREQADAIESQLDTAVHAGQDEIARAKLTQLNQAQNAVQQLSDRWHTYATAAEKLRIEVQDLQGRLTAIQGKLSQSAPAPVAHATDQAKQRLAQTAQSTGDAAPIVQSASKPADSSNTPSPPLPADADKTLDQTRITDLLKKRGQ